ncbi:ABC transporter substrate-binding protein [Microbacterium terrisoli]|uniref:ABC transporter substrate-binding protein n=1 Tax=Microbacterium terrisoli TaxID=3242192 RepID=UPI002803B544|nr:extracellular solute-binding protein [Microbacterium protaetiae]
MAGVPVQERKEMRKQLIGLLALGAVAAMTLTACSSGGGTGKTGGSDVDYSAKPSGTLNAWAFNNADDVGKARLGYAAAQLKGVDVKIDGSGFDPQKFTTRLASGNVPDIVQLDRPNVTQYAAQGLLMPLDACFKARGVDPQKRWYPYVVDDVTYKGKVWAAPQFYQPPAILLNMDVLRAAGVTPDQIDTSKPDVLLPAIAKMYKASGGVPTTLGLDPDVPNNDGLWVLGMGGQITDADGKPTLDDPKNAAGIDLLKKIMDAQGGYAKVKSLKDSFDAFGDNNQFVAKQVGADVYAQWYPNVLSPYLDKIDLQAVPFKGSDGKPFSVAGGTSFAIPVGAKNPVAACAWMDEITNLDSWIAAEEARVATLKKNGGINTGLFTGSPEADQKIRDGYVKPSGNADFDQVIQTYYGVLDYGKTFGSSPAGQTITQELANAVTSVLLGEKSTDQALKDAQAASLRAYDNATKG